MPDTFKSLQQPSLDAEGQPDITVRLRGSVELIVPGSLQRLTTYVLLEQEDWFESEIAFVRKLLPAGARVVDVGANYGVYTTAIARAIGPTGRLWAFEPASTTASFLRRSIAHNQFKNVDLLQAALSDCQGTASLQIFPNTELNALTRTTPGAGRIEQVPLYTLDECMRELNWGGLDFLKLDAEGHEENILQGGVEFFHRESPLVMFELKHGDSVNTALLHRFQGLGYEFYRLIPGIGLLAPIEFEHGVDTYQLNLFACKPDRATALEASGLLSSTSGENLAVPDDEPSKLRAVALDDSLPPSWRLANLRKAAANAERDAAVPTAARLHAAARIAWELGNRAKAVIWLMQLVQQCSDPASRGPAADASAPVLTASPQFDNYPVPGALPQWIEASARDQLVRLRHFSTYFTGKESLGDLESIRAHGFANAEMERRYQLIRLRYGLQAAPEPCAVLAAQSADNLNPWFWTQTDDGHAGHAPGKR